jgi:USP8 dimerisation domain
MNSSYATDIFTQVSQFQPATFQPGPTRVYQNPNSVPSNIAQAAPAPSQVQAPSRPYSIAELAECAKQSLGDESRPFKAWLRVAESARRDAKSLYEQGDFESAFVEYAKAATIVLEKIPGHPDYRVLLSSTQRHNMGLVRYLYSLGSHTCASVGHVHVPYQCIDECIFRVLHACHLI